MEDFSEEEKFILKLHEMYNAGLCWECGSSLIIDFRNPDKDNWVEAICPNCSYRTYIPRGI